MQPQWGRCSGEGLLFIARDRLSGLEERALNSLWVRRWVHALELPPSVPFLISSLDPNIPSAKCR